MRALIVLLIALLLPAAAEAGLRATYGVTASRPLTIEVADNGDVAAELSPYRRLLVRGGIAIIVEESLTGPVVMRLSDLQAIVEARRRAERRRAPPQPEAQFIPRGPMVVNGRTGAAYWRPTPYGSAPEQLVAMISDDPALAPLGRAMRHVREAQDAFEALQTGLPDETLDWTRPIDALLDAGTPLRHWGWTLRTVETAATDPSSFVPPAEPQSMAAVAARYDPASARAEEEQALRSQMIYRAVFASGRLWLLTDDGALTSLAEGELRRTAHDLGAPVADICASRGSLLAITGRRRGNEALTVHRLASGRWQRGRTIPQSGASLTALSCGAAGEMLVTSDRLIDVVSGEGIELRVSDAAFRTPLRTVVHATPDALFLGHNSGEWGGGVQRIDRRTGEIAAIERNETGERCGGPLNSRCDPVNGFAESPWRPGCVAAAIGLSHFFTRGRIAQICPSGVEELTAVPDPDLHDPETERSGTDARSRRYETVAFYGLAARGNELIAVGHNGLYRIGAEGQAAYRRFPRFTQVDGVFVSFELPDVVLVLSQLNRRASVGGSAPLLVIR